MLLNSDYIDFDDLSMNKCILPGDVDDDEIVTQFQAERLAKSLTAWCLRKQCHRHTLEAVHPPEELSCRSKIRRRRADTRTVEESVKDGCEEVAATAYHCYDYLDRLIIPYLLSRRLGYLWHV